jgi:hypothetical protein
MGALILFTAVIIRGFRPKGTDHCSSEDIDSLMLTRVWQELEYRIDVCRVTRGAHIEHF